MYENIPLKKPTPDAGEFIDILLGRKTGSRTPLVEYIVNDPVMKPIVTDLLERPWINPGDDRDSHKAFLDNFIAFWHHLGYDAVRFERGLPFPVNWLQAESEANTSAPQRAWVDEHHGTISCWKDFEKYPWPKLEEFDFFPFEYIDSHLPEGMGLLTSHAGGIFEHLSTIMSLEGLGFALYEAPDLMKAISDRLGELMTGFYEHILQLENIIALFPGDDMGFRTGTLVSPDDLGKYCLPWHKRFAIMSHDRGLPYFLHSCGNIEAIMPDLLEEIGIDGKHSFEDAIIPIQDFQAKYGDRIAVLGGMDVNLLASSSPGDIRRHTRFLVETCGSRGRFAIGSGNSIPDYVPVSNYLAMVDEALKLQKP